MLFLIVYVLTKVFYQASLTFYDSMLNDVTTEERMDQVSSYGYAWGYIGSCIPFLVAMVAYILSGGLSENLMLFSPLVGKIIGFGVTAIWWLLVTLPLIRNYQQKNYVEHTHTSVSQVFKKIFATLKKIAVRDKKVLFFLIAFFLYIDGVGTIIDNCINMPSRRPASTTSSSSPSGRFPMTSSARTSPAKVPSRNTSKSTLGGNKHVPAVA